MTATEIARHAERLGREMASEMRMVSRCLPPWITGADIDRAVEDAVEDAMPDLFVEAARRLGGVTR